MTPNFELDKPNPNILLLFQDGTSINFMHFLFQKILYKFNLLSYCGVI